MDDVGAGPNPPGAGPLVPVLEAVGVVAYELVDLLDSSGYRVLGLFARTIEAVVGLTDPAWSDGRVRMAPTQDLQRHLPDPFSAVETARLTLQCVRAGDAAATATMMTPAVSRWTGSWASPTTEAMALERVEEARAAAAAGAALPFAVVRRSDGVLLGWVGVTRDAARPGLGSLRYWFGEEHHGRGYAKEAAATAVGAGFERLGLEVIEAGAQAGNAASFAVMRACGMTPVGERTVFASARERDEVCLFHEVRGPRR